AALLLLLAWDAFAPSNAALPESSKACLPCHERQVLEWRESWMARAYTDPAFQHDLEKLRALEDGSQLPPGFARDCLRCHAPLAYYGEDRELRTEASREGVTCTVCHGIVNLIDVDERRKTFQIDLKSPVIYGPSETPKETPAHRLRHSPVLRRSELCMMCHHDTSRNAPYELKWEEYQASPYPALGIRCQDCHMRATESHRFPGGHSDSPLLTGAASLTIEEAKEGLARIRVTNVGVGHRFPTRGAHEPELRLVLEVRDEEGRLVETGVRSFRYAFVDGTGAVQRLGEPTAPIVGAKDSTLPPQDSRVETFELAAVQPGRELSAYLEYRLVPEYRRHVYPAEMYEKYFRPTRVAETSLTVRRRAP
ncbi:MAG: multiheme c-type cytochrome, partial [Candidatus Binatia bacterium]